MQRSRPRPSETFEWLGWRVDDCHGRRVGTLVAMYENELSGLPAWFLVRLSRFSSRFVLAPPADVLAWTSRVWLPYERETIEGAPLLFAPPLQTSPALERQLKSHYRLTAEPPGEVRVSARRTPA